MTSDFDRFWSEYPRRAGGNPKHPASLKFAAAIKAGASAEDIIAGARAYRLECEASKIIGSSYIAMASTWLNQRRWTDLAPQRKALVTAKLTWLTVDDPRWPQASAAWRDAHGKLPPTVPGLGGQGWHFPTPLMGTESATKTEAPHDAANRRAPADTEQDHDALSVQSDLFCFAAEIKPGTAPDTAHTPKVLGTVTHRTSRRDETVSSNRDRRQFG